MDATAPYHRGRKICMRAITREHVEQISIEALLSVKHISVVLLAALEEATATGSSAFSKEARTALALGQDQCETIARNVAVLHEVASLWWEREEARGREV
jgi:uncharacterized protein (DUF2384 family)